MKVKTIYTLIGVCILILLWAPLSSAEMSSPSYWIPALVLDGGGLQSSSENFLHVGTIGQSTPIGFSNSTNYYNQSGFIPQISEFPLEECMEENSGNIDITGTFGQVGNEIQIPVVIQSSPKKIRSFGMEIGYDPRILKFSSFTHGNLITSFEIININPIAPGKLKLGGLSYTADISEKANGDLVYLKFTVANGEEGMCYPLQVISVFDDVADFSVSGACFCISRSCNGDLNKDGGITPADALMAFECFLGTDSCPECGDVNKDGAVTPSDALCIFEKFLGLPSCLD